MLGDGDGKCSSGHDTTSLLLTAPRPAVRALDRRADPVATGPLADDSAAARRAGDCTGSVEDERRPHSRRGAAVSLGSVAGPARKSGGDDRTRASICTVAPRLSTYLLM